jgi:hypothetical protein
MSARARRRRKRALRQAGAITGIVLSLGILGGMVYAYAAHRPPPLDPKTLCRTDAPLQGHTIILIDASDPLPPLEADRVRALAAAEREKLPRFDKLTILMLTPAKPFEPKVAFSKCSPGSGAIVNPWIENGDQIKRRFTEAIEKPLDRRIGRAVKGKRAKYSPILETVSSIPRRFDFTAAVPRRRLVIVSDFLQNTPNGYSHYQGAKPSLAGLQTDPLWPKVKSRFDGAQVLLEYVPRPDDAALQTPAHREFWRDYFASGGAAGIIYLDENPEAGL